VDVGRCALALAHVLVYSCFRAPLERLRGNEACLWRTSKVLDFVGGW
jgi:hypothetical protein